MPLSSKTKSEDRVLAWVNRQREKAGSRSIQRLPRGYCEDPERCVLAQALPGVQTWVMPDKHDAAWGEGPFFDSKPLPAYVAAFARGFDEGRYPHLKKRAR